jgi:hypothetical protein
VCDIGFASSIAAGEARRGEEEKIRLGFAPGFGRWSPEEIEDGLTQPRKDETRPGPGMQISRAAQIGWCSVRVRVSIISNLNSG